MSAASVLFAAGPSGVELQIPAALTLTVGEGVHVKPPALESAQRAIVTQALASSSEFKEAIKGKRRAAILVGDLTRPAPYDIALPALLTALVEAEIRPSRIAFLACPGGSSPLLGRAAIHRYGEEICGDHEVFAWPSEGTPGPYYDSADLRIAVAPCMDGVGFHAFLPAGVTADLSLELSLGRGVQIEIESARVFAGAAHRPVPVGPVGMPPQSRMAKADVALVSGGGSPWEETLEEALLCLHAPRFSTRTAVLVFSGEEGLGASRFARDAWSLIEQAETVLAAGKSLGSPSKLTRFDPADVLAECLKRYERTILFSHEFAEHPEGDDLIDRLNEAPHVGGSLNVCGSQAALWSALELVHGAVYSVHAEPLGWRAR